MPQNRAIQPRSGVRARWGGVGAFAFAIALAVTGCASTVPSAPAGADTPVIAISDTSQPPTIDLSSPSYAAPVTSALASASAPASAVPTHAKSTPAVPKVVTTTHALVQPKPKPKPTPVPPSLCGAPQNPFGYNFCGRGGHIYSPAGETCSYFNCIANFQNGRGYMVKCVDRTYSMSGGISGACSRHGGEERAVYSG